MLLFLPCWAQFITSFHSFFLLFSKLSLKDQNPLHVRPLHLGLFIPINTVAFIITFALFCIQKHMYSIFLPRQTIWDHAAPVLNVPLWIHTVVNQCIWPRADARVALKRKHTHILYPVLHYTREFSFSTPSYSPTQGSCVCVKFLCKLTLLILRDEKQSVVKLCHSLLINCGLASWSVCPIC